MGGSKSVLGKVRRWAAYPQLARVLRHGPNHPVALWLALIIGVLVPIAGLLAWAVAIAWPDRGDPIDNRLDLVIVGSMQDEPATQMTNNVVAEPGSTVHIRIRYSAETADFLDDVVLRMIEEGPAEIVPLSAALTTALGVDRLPDTALGSGGINLGDYVGVPLDRSPETVSGQIQLLMAVDSTASCTIRLTVVGRAVGLAESASVMLIPIDLDGDGRSDTSDC